MALAVVTTPAVPNVPVAAGVPAVFRKVGAIEAEVVLIAADALLLASIFSGPKWGVFDKTGTAIGTPSSVKSFEYRNGYAISNYPQENGAFASYNKVKEPYEAHVELTFGGASAGLLPQLPGQQAASRGSIMYALLGAVDSLDLYTVRCPEGTFSNANVISLDFHRSRDQGSTMITVSLHIQEVRLAATEVYTAKQDDSAVDAVSGGYVAPTVLPYTSEALPPLSTSGSTAAAAPAAAVATSGGTPALALPQAL